MTTGSSPQPALAGLPSGPSVRRRGMRLRDARIRSKLAMILLVPLVAVLALAAVRLIDVGGRAYDASQIQELATLSTNVSALTQSLHSEQMAAAEFLAKTSTGSGAYTTATHATDDQIHAYTSRAQ